MKGAAKGAAAGAAIGAITGDAGEGAAVGAVVGGLAGRRQGKEAQAQQNQQSQANAAAAGPSYGDSIGKEAAILNWKSNVENLYESIHYNRSRFASVTIPDGENKGEWVANWAELTIVYQNDRGSVTIWANTNYLVENGRITKSLTFYNEADALRQLGYKIVPPGDIE